MPWKHTNDPYKIWLSEIILQQTRVEQGISYYERLVERFPSVEQLALAPEDEVMKYWEGLGYYSRARNLHAAAKQIFFDRDGVFPSTYTELLQLKGVGKYTAAAISSFAFNLPHAVIDGNVLRLLARYFGVKDLSDSTVGQRVFIKLADDLLDKSDPGDYNQAIMNYGALICKPISPNCLICDLHKKCFAYTHGLIKNLPVKRKKKKLRIRWFNYLVLENKTHLILRKRIAEDIWKGLYEFPLIETDNRCTATQLETLFRKKNIFQEDNVGVIETSKIIKHKLTHQCICTQFLHINLPFDSNYLKEGYLKVKKDDINNLPFPKVIENYLEHLLY